MQIKLARKYGFCYGVQRAISIAEHNKNSYTYGALIHNQNEINRLNTDFKVGLKSDIKSIEDDDTIIIRTHGITKEDKQLLEQKAKLIDATCPFVTTPQNIAKQKRHVIIT